ncbi:hypothetical protein HG537_0B03920 [Torulaspora globosa]|uniref:PUM-HD domain-containing protein n=1 Tax=Torulaspora globosa TaxID=48254 RepID=A0A7H9HRQ9_9SACH|nr:hypothetical protein HG537_0B03920 [Torulaspora sp. CBS 2947]
MSEKKVVRNNTVANNGGTLSNIPEVIDPGITIPIYEEEVMQGTSGSGHVEVQPQKLGSYRSRAGKFSNTLSNLLPSISAKLHHSKKGTQGKALGDDSPNNNSSESTVDSGNAYTTAGNGKSFIQSIGTIPIEGTESLTPPQEMEKLVHFPDANFLVGQPRKSNDSFTFGGSGLPQHRISRTRNSTISSQITSMSSIPANNGSSSVIWSNNQNSSDPLQQHLLQQFNSNNINQNSLSASNTSPLNEYSTSTTYFDTAIPSSNVNATLAGGNNGINLTVPGSMWSQNNASNRPRSLSNASSIYTDAPLYEQPTRSRAASTYTLSQAHAGQPQEIPFIEDDIDPRSINWVTTDPLVPAINQISNLLPTNTISISNVFSLQQQQPQLMNAVNLTSASLATLCSKYGVVISATTLKGLNMALVEFDSVESAIRALDALQGKEVSMIGAPSCVSFAKVLPMHQQTPQVVVSPRAAGNVGSDAVPQPLLQEQLFNGTFTFQQQGNISLPIFSHQQPDSRSQPAHAHPNSNQGFGHSSQNEKEQCPFPLPPPPFQSYIGAVEDIMESFDTPFDQTQTSHIINNALKHRGTSDTTDFGPLPEPLTVREFDAPKLRELRKNIDANLIPDIEIEQLAIAMLDELPELSSDYLGNTIVQKLFTHSSDIIKDIMLRKTSKYLTSMGIHKNGTWACQKMISMARTPRQIMLVTNGVKDYCTPLFNDQFGNYVIQCVLRFGFPWNSFIFESIAANFWTIAQNRYGARAVRACLEAHDIITQEEMLVISALIVLYAEYLATNSNGTLLVSWFLDTCSLRHKHSMLAPRLLSHMVELCRHRLASLTVLKLLNYRGDDIVRKKIAHEIFGEPITDEPALPLRQILCDTNYGPTFIYKVLTMSSLEGDLRNHAVRQVRKILLETTPSQQHRRLMEEVGLTPTASQHNSQNKHCSSISQVFNQDTTHLRGLSVSSVRSNGSRHSGLAAATSAGQPSIPPSNNSTWNVGYSNYPGIFPGFANTAYPVTTEDLSNQFDMMSLNNGTHISLPQLSLTNQNNSTNLIYPTKSTSSQDPHIKNHGMFGQ